MNKKIITISDGLKKKTGIDLTDKLPLEEISRSIENILTIHITFGFRFLKTCGILTGILCLFIAAVLYFVSSSPAVVIPGLLISLIILMSTGTILGLKSGLKGIREDLINLAHFSIQTIKSANTELKEDILATDLAQLVMYQVIIPLVEKITVKNKGLFYKTAYKVIETVLFSFTKTVTTKLEIIKKNISSVDNNDNQKTVDKEEESDPDKESETKQLDEIDENIESIIKIASKPVDFLLNTILFPFTFINAVLVFIYLLIVF